MRLTIALLKRKMPPGNIWLGKNRLAHHVYPENIERMVKRLKVEEQNMLLLRHPFLSRAHEKDSNMVYQARHEFLQKQTLERAACKIRPSVRMEQFLSHLLVEEKWDV